MSKSEKIITVNFKSAVEADDLFMRLLQVHPQSQSFERYREKYFDHPQLADDIRRRIQHLNIENVDLVTYIIEKSNLESVNKRTSAIAAQGNDWLRFRVNITLRALGLSQENIKALGWLKHDAAERIQFCLAMFEDVSRQPTTFADHWGILRKSTVEVQGQIIDFLGRTPDPRAIAFLKAFAQGEDLDLALLAVVALGRRRDDDVLTFIEYLWKHHHGDGQWQKSLLIALRRIYLCPVV